MAYPASETSVEMLDRFYDSMGLKSRERPATPDPRRLWTMLEETGLRGGDPASVVSRLLEVQRGLFGPGGRLEEMPDHFRIDEQTLERGLAGRDGQSGEVDWQAWEGRHVGTFSGPTTEPFDDTHVWYPSARISEAWEVQPVEFRDKPTGYNVTYRFPGWPAVQAGYVTKGDVVEDGAHLGHAGRQGAMHWIVWRLPQDAFLEVVGPVAESAGSAAGRWRTAFNLDGAWGRWRLEPLQNADPRIRLA